jgi:hypothetical protein
MILMTAGLEPVTTTGQMPAGRVARSIGLHAIAAAFMYVLLPFLVPAALMNAGLKNGRKGVWGALAGAALILLVITAAASTPSVFPSQFAGIVRLVLEIGVPVAIILPLVRRSAPFGTVALVAIAVSIVGFFATEIMMRDLFAYSPYESVVKIFREVADWSLAQSAGKQPAEQARMMKSMADAVANSFMPSMLLMLSVSTFIISLIVVPRLASGRGTGTTYLFRNLAFPDMLLVVFVLSGLAPFADGIIRVIGLNVLFVVCFLYVIQGLAVFRALLLRMGLPLFGTAVAFAVLGLLTPYGIAPFALFLAGLFDPFFDFRNFNRKDENDESDFD